MRVGTIATGRARAVGAAAGWLLWGAALAAAQAPPVAVPEALPAGVVPAAPVGVPQVPAAGIPAEVPPGFGPSVADADSSVAFIDSALVRSTLRLRYDDAWNFRRPTRAEFFWPQTGPAGRGPLSAAETNVDYQEFNLYGEYAVGGLPLSVFAEVPLRLTNPDVNSNETGLGDVNAGLKLGVIRSPDLNATVQFRTYTPTGDGRRGLGTEHVSLEPAFLWNARLLEVVVVEGEVRYWTPAGGTDFAGDVVRYGLGFSYSNRCSDEFWLSPVAEFVGWSVLNGKQFGSPTPNVEGGAATILNASLGLRLGWAGRWDAYAGYSRALTGEYWFKDDVRAEFRVFY